MDEDRRDEPLAGLMAGMLRDEVAEGVLRLEDDLEVGQQRRRWPLAVAVAAVVTLLSMLVVGIALYWRPQPGTGREAKPVVQSVPGAVPSPSAYLAITPPPPPHHLFVRRHAVPRPRSEPRRADEPGPAPKAEMQEFAPPERAYGPYPATPLGPEALRRVLVDDRRRTRELNERELGNVQDR